jgi:hypothetical protein
MEIKYALILKEGDITVSKEYGFVPGDTEIQELFAILNQQLENV